MLHTDVLKRYKKMFPFVETTIDSWYQNGYNSIRIRFRNTREIVFTYKDDSDWKLETIESFMRSMIKK